MSERFAPRRLPREARALLLGTALLSGCAPSQPPHSTLAPGDPAPDAPPSKNDGNEKADASPKASSSGSAWLFEAKPDLRRLTVVVESSPPRALANTFRAIAMRHKELGAFFEAHASESFGSGFLMVHREEAPGASPRIFVVTNHHVVGLADDVTIRFDGEVTPATARVVFVDDSYDLAVLEITDKPDLASPITSGFRPAPATAHDQDVVIAVGYPGLAGKPSYQVTQGTVSNERFALPNVRKKLLYIQHTAPIDPGSSGGPLIDENGSLLGMNTYKALGREGVGIAVPAKAIERALEEAAETKASIARDAATACSDLLALLRSDDPDTTELGARLGSSLVANHGLDSLDALEGDFTEWRERFIVDPGDVFLAALALRIRRTELDASESPKCAPLPTKSEKEEKSAFSIVGAKKKTEWLFAREQNRYKLVDAGLGPSKSSRFFEAGTKPSPGKKWTPKLR